jgi:predicted Zn-dependent protease
MDGAGFAASGMSGMFEKLDNSAKLNDSGLYPYLRSHPLTSERVSEAKLRALDSHAPSPPQVSSAEHALMQARARVLMDGRDPSLRRLQALGQPGSPALDLNRLGALYSAALAAARLGEFGSAQTALAAGSALAQQRFSHDGRVLRAFTLLGAELATEQALRTRDMNAAAALRTAATARPAGGGRPELLSRAAAARALQTLGDATAPAALRTATEDLQVWVAEQRLDASAWQALAQCADLLGLRLRSLRAGGEAAWALGDLTGAVDRFRAAQAEARRAGPDQYLEARIIESRLREVENARRQQVLEERGG